MNKINGAFAIFFSFFLLVQMSAMAQSIKMNEGGFDMQIFPVDTTLFSFFCGQVQLPEFQGGTSKLIAFTKQKLNYPKVQ